MAYNSDVREPMNVSESGKFVRIENDTRFPPLSTQIINPGDKSIVTSEYSKYAVLTHIVNASDINISLCASNVDIGNVGIIDHTSGTDVYAQITRTDTVGGFEVGAVSVITSGVNSISGNVTINNPVSSFSLVNPVTSVTVLNPVSSFSLVNPVTAFTVLNPVSSFSLVNPVTAVSITTSQTLPISGSVTILNPVSSFSLVNPVTAFTVLNPVSSFSLVNPVTSVDITTTQTLPVSGNVTITNTISTFLVSPAVPVSFADNATIDAFQRLRVSEPVTLFESKQLHNMSTMFWSNSSLDGNVYHTGFSDPSITLSVSANGGYAIRQTTQRFNYQSGKSMLYMFTGILNPETNIIKRYGCFSSLTAAPFTPNVGLYFEASDDTMYCVQNNTGFLVPSVSASRDEWNIDKLDGTGPSGQTITLSGTNIFVIDYEWLGVGRVRYGVVLDGHICYCHKIDNTGRAGAYLRTPNHPVRAELRQTGIGSGSMKMICSTVISEGGSDFSGVTRSIDTASNTIASGTRSAILGVRLQSDKLDSVNQIINAGVICMQQAASNQAPYKYELVLNPAGVSGGTWSNITESNFQKWVGNSTPTADTGFILANGFGSAGAGIDLGTFNLKKFLRLGTTINGIRDELYLVITPLAANDGVYATLSFIESD